MTENPSITFVCCIESGWLENQTLRMIESLRRWGGQFANVPIFAVTPRFGPPLAHKTHQAFERLNVQHIRYQAQNKYSWKAFLNKHYALVAAEERSKSECIGWLDSDLLILDEPDQLILKEEEDFLACSPDGCGGTTGSGDAFEYYWGEVCKSVGINIEDLPWIQTELEGKRIRLYFNSGVFVYRRSTGLAKQHLQDTIKLFDSHIASRITGTYFTQHILGMTVVKMGLSWRQLPHSHNYGMGSKIHNDQWYSQEKLKATKILHYHDSMWPHFWPTFMECLCDTHPDVAEWLSSLGPMQNESPPQWRTFSKIIDYFRSKQELAYKESCRVI
ncbi:MAG: hypothetical protein QNJ36_06225 [Calothrix sp. MO_167.B42]|nr:hypothetical protein [Calothrix sp. MO_167.B42]